jgi:hypothetical protein
MVPRLRCNAIALHRSLDTLFFPVPALHAAPFSRGGRRRMDGYPKTAACVCGALKVSVSGPPVNVHACACLDCQRRTGSAFSCTAFFAETDASVSGEFKSFRRIADSGRVNEANFCPACGASVFLRLEGLPNVIGVAVGCFADPAFERPGTLYWTVRRHGWLAAPLDAAMVERQ